MRKLLLLFIAFVGIECQAQVNKYGLPFITNFDLDQIGVGGEQNWDIVQDNRGIVYFANQNGVLEYDGNSWRRISVNNNGVMSLSVDAKGIIHVATSGTEFGYLAPNEIGELEYVSLNKYLSDTLEIGGIWKSISLGDKTYYSTKNGIIAEKDDTVEFIKFPFDNAFWAFPLEDTSIVVSRPNGNFIIYHNGKFEETSLNIGAVYGCVPLKNDEFLFASDNGRIYRVCLKNWETKEVSNPVLDSVFDQGAIPYSMKKFDNDIVITFIYDSGYGVVILDEELQVKNVLDGELYLNKTANVTNSLQADDVLWTASSMGISRIEYGGAFTMYDGNMGISGNIYDIIECGGIMYVATENAIYYKERGASSFSVYEDETSAYSFSKYYDIKNKTEKILAATSNGILVVEGKKSISKISDKDAYRVYQSKTRPEYMYYSNNNGEIGRFVYDKNTDLWEKENIPVFVGSIGSINEDKYGNIWFSDFDNRKLVKYMQLQGTYKLYSENEESGLPSIYQVSMVYVDSTLLFCTEKGIYEFNEEKSSFVISDMLGDAGQDSTHSYYGVKRYAGDYVVSNYNENQQKYWISVVSVDGKKSNIFRTPFFRLKDNVGMEVLYVDSDNNLWIPMSDILYCYRSSAINPEKPYYENPYNAHIRQVTLNDTMTIFGGTYKSPDGKGISLKQGEKEMPVLKFDNGQTLTFSYSATCFEKEDELLYSTALVEKGESSVSWSAWKPDTKYERYGLREGEYTFMVKAKNIYGKESNVAEYTFTIAPPFYRTFVAYLFYVLAAIASIYGIVKWNTHRLIEEKKKLERKIAEATEEIRGQNVQLEQQKDEIEKQKDEIQASINYARRIQRALLTPDETIDQVFPDHFLLYKPRNVVSGDYYWIGQFGDNKVCIVADCTGHGVPGGFMSMLGMTNLNYIVGQELRPDEILNKLRAAIITSLRQKDDTTSAPNVVPEAIPVEKKDRSQDGMDVAMYVINEKEMTLSFAGANNPLVLIRDGEVQVVKASKMPVGIYAKLDPFERVDMEIKKGDCLYTFSDGFQDQFGHETGRKFMSKHLREILLEIHQKPMAEQKEILNKTYEDWRGPADLQTDDVVLMGVRI